MGVLAWRAGDYSILIRDYEYPNQYDSDDKELVIDKNHIFNITITNLITGSEKQKEVPLFKLYNLDENGLFETEENETLSPRDWIFNKVNSTKEGVLVMPTLSLHGRISESYSPPEYYLQSDIFDNDIEVGVKAVELKVTTIDEMDWLFYNGFTYASHSERLKYLKDKKYQMKQ